MSSRVGKTQTTRYLATGLRTDYVAVGELKVSDVIHWKAFVVRA